MKPSETRLELGFVRTDQLKDEVLKEVLDHLGILYEEAIDERFPCFVSSTRDFSVRAAFGRNVLVADEIVPLDEIACSLSGTVSIEDRDAFELDINNYENGLLKALREAFWQAGLPLVRKWFWPGFSEACCVLTHDVDFLTYSPLHMVILRKESPWKAFGLILRHLLMGEEYGYNIPEVLETERSRGVRSTFFFRTDYGRVNENARKAQEAVRSNDSEIGLHASRGSHEDSDILRDELTRIERSVSSKIKGNRYHRLKFRSDVSWRIEDETGFEYDASFANNRFFGFKSQLCFPYHPVDLERRARLGILEIPTAFMDWTAINRGYDHEDCRAVLSEVMDSVQKNHGCFAVNFHNTYINKKTFQEIYETYLWLLEEIRARKYWTATGIQCHDWWSMRADSQVSIGLDNGVVVGCSSAKNLPIIIDRSDGEAELRTVTGPFRIEE